MTRRKPPKFVWVARECDTYNRTYGLWANKPRLDDWGYWGGRESALIIEGLCPDRFERMTGLTLNPGGCRRVAWRSPFVGVEATNDE